MNTEYWKERAEKAEGQVIGLRDAICKLSDKAALISQAVMNENLRQEKKLWIEFDAIQQAALSNPIPTGWSSPEESKAKDARIKELEEDIDLMKNTAWEKSE